MSRAQWTAIAVTMALSAIDGFDVLSITLAAPGLVRDWGIDHGSLGILLSASLAGMAIGALALAPLADLMGRRRLIFAALALTGFGMALGAIADSVAFLCLCRVLTGLGVGAMASIINPTATEFANERRRDFAVAMMAVGYPLGGVLGGIVASLLLESFGWRSLFWLGGALSAIMVPVVWRWLPEPLSFLIERPDARSLTRANALLLRFGHPPVTALPSPAAEARTAGPADIFRRGMVRVTLAVTIMNLCYVMAVYYALSWMPQLVVDRGFSPSEAARVSLYASLAGVVSGALLGWAAPLVGLKRISFTAIAGMGLLTMIFSLVPADLDALRLVAIGLGICLFAGMVAIHAIISRSFEDRLRATGAGFVMGIGRIGSAIAPLIAGFLFAAGFGQGAVSAAMGGLALFAAIILLAIPMREAPVAALFRFNPSEAS